MQDCHLTSNSVADQPRQVNLLNKYAGGVPAPPDAWKTEGSFFAYVCTPVESGGIDVRQISPLHERRPKASHPASFQGFWWHPSEPPKTHLIPTDSGNRIPCCVCGSVGGENSEEDRLPVRAQELNLGNSGLECPWKVLV